MTILYRVGSITSSVMTLGPPTILSVIILGSAENLSTLIYAFFFKIS